MINFRNTNIFFLVLLIGLIGYHVTYGLPIFIYFLLALLYSLVLFYGSYFIQAGFYIRSICEVETTKKEIAISFDDGPANDYTPSILEILREHNIEAAFFCIGKRIEGNEDLLKAVHEQGHIIGNHSFSHATWFDLFSSKKMLDDIRMMDEKMKKIIGTKPKFFRPPYGVTNPNLKKAIVDGEYISIGWNIRSLDTVIKDEKKLLAKVTKAVKPGSIVLFHDTSKTMLNILPDFINYLISEGYMIRRLDKMLNLNPYV
ncbi:MAG: polysaccharide deacetylase family protein [Bacteroidetes bacterium]|nr:polysaccharide deacetylase family protein [Bacteroidota bacterium]